MASNTKTFTCLALVLTAASAQVNTTTIEFNTPDAAVFTYEVNDAGIMKGEVTVDADSFFALGFSTGLPGVAPGPMSAMEYAIVGEEREGEQTVTIRLGTGERTRPQYSEAETEARVRSFEFLSAGMRESAFLACSPVDKAPDGNELPAWLTQEWCSGNCFDGEGTLSPACDPEQGFQLCACVSQPQTSFGFEVDVNGFPDSLLFAYTPGSREFTRHAVRGFHDVIDL